MDLAQAGVEPNGALAAEPAGALERRAVGEPLLNRRRLPLCR